MLHPEKEVVIKEKRKFIKETVHENQNKAFNVNPRVDLRGGRWNPNNKHTILGKLSKKKARIKKHTLVLKKMGYDYYPQTWLRWSTPAPNTEMGKSSSIKKYTVKNSLL